MRLLPGLSFLSLCMLLLCTGCAPPEAVPDEATVRAEIEAALAQGIEATRNKDIDAYMEGMPADLLIYDESGEVITREMQRANVLRDWSIIPKTLDLQIVVDSLEVYADSAVVYTSQRWERLMLRRDGVTTDTVLTTQRHRELWRDTPEGWMGYEIVELGGRVYINGEPYQP